MQTIDLKALWDVQTILRNPHKGWYHHYFDNGLDKYLPRADADLERFPGMDHLYLRLAWGHLEPERGKFRWSLIDDVIEKWTGRGLGISFRITCKESDGRQRFATPEWVKDAGARGRFVTAWDQETWLPDYGDPVFLKHLEAFHRAFAARYDGKPWLEYVDIGSYGQWGEGHNWMAGDEDAPIDVIKEHVAIHKRHYARTALVVSDDIAGGRKDKRGPELADWLVAQGISFRDDSVGVRFYTDRYPADSLRSPELFERVWRDRPTVLELQHYGIMKDPKGDNSWRGPNGAEYGAQYFENALRRMHATFIGYHGDAAEWLRDNPDLTRRFANLCGYWYFPERAVLPDRLTPGRASSLAITWLNRGVAPSYRRFALRLRLRGSQGRVAWSEWLDGSDSRRWMPEQSAAEEFAFTPPARLDPDEYTVEVGLATERSDAARTVRLALLESVRTEGDLYRLGTVAVVR